MTCWRSPRAEGDLQRVCNTCPVLIVTPPPMEYLTLRSCLLPPAPQELCFVPAGPGWVCGDLETCFRGRDRAEEREMAGRAWHLILHNLRCPGHWSFHTWAPWGPEGGWWVTPRGNHGAEWNPWIWSIKTKSAASRWSVLSCRFSQPEENQKAKWPPRPVVCW